jgi:alkylation response protein AidB-like acyl-CoA dehydrogenase
MHFDLPDETQLLQRTVREFAEGEVAPVAEELDRTKAFPYDLVREMGELGWMGIPFPEEVGGAGGTSLQYAIAVEELTRVDSSVAITLCAHTSLGTQPIYLFGTDEQKERYLPLMATGEVRATMALTEPGGGSDLQASTTIARADGDDLVINGAKTWISNARRSQLIALLCKTDPEAKPTHKGMSIVLVEHGPGLTVSNDLPKLGYKGIEACELSFSDYRTPTSSILGAVPGKGFTQFMKGLETGRIQVASRALGVAAAAFEDSLRYAQEREAFGKPIWKHQSIGNYLADMATKLTAARQLTKFAADRIDHGDRSDLEAGMAKLFASEVAMEIALNAVRIHGGNGYSTEFDVERYFRDAPLMIVGEGTNEIQRNVIAQQLVARGGIS